MMIFNVIQVFRVLVFPGFFFIVLLTFFCDWVERKVEARMQNRIGPTTAGPMGILQPVADFIKLLTKEDMVPRSASGVLFSLAPIVAFSTFVFALFYLPIDGENVLVGSGFEGDLIFVLALVSMANFFLFFSGWASNNPYSDIGAARVLTQFLGYEIPLSILALSPALLANDLSITKISSCQAIPFAIFIPWAFAFFVITLQAELEKDPFDIPHAETEIVGGYETEYSGRKLAFLKLAKDVQIVLGAAIVVELFLGGPYGPVFFGLPAFWHTLWFTLKLLAVILVTEYLTCIFARLRIDQVLSLNWKLLFPVSILSLALTLALRLGLSAAGR